MHCFQDSILRNLCEYRHKSQIVKNLDSLSYNSVADIMLTNFN